MSKMLRASNKARIKIWEVLSAVVEKQSEDECIYKQGWNDAVVATEVSKILAEPVSVHSVSSFRQEVFGHIRKGSASVTARTILERKFDDLLKRHNELAARIERIERNLGGQLF